MKPRYAWIVFLIGMTYLFISYQGSVNGSIHLTFFEPLAVIGFSALLLSSARRILLLIAGYWLVIVAAVWISLDLQGLLYFDAPILPRVCWILLPMIQVIFGMRLLLLCGQRVASDSDAADHPPARADLKAE